MIRTCSLKQLKIHGAHLEPTGFQGCCPTGVPGSGYPSVVKRNSTNLYCQTYTEPDILYYMYLPHNTPHYYPLYFHTLHYYTLLPHTTVLHISIHYISIQHCTTVHYIAAHILVCCLREHLSGFHSIWPHDCYCRCNKNGITSLAKSSLPTLIFFRV